MERRVNKELTRSQVKKFRDSIQNFDSMELIRSGVNPMIADAQLHALQSQLRELEKPLEQFETLQLGVLNAQYDVDKQIMENMKPSEILEFQNWMVRLEEIMDDFGKKYGQRPYGKPLSESTGLDCWYCSYEDGSSPQQAFDDDRDCWD